MAEWSDWYAREDPTTWVLAEILKRRASETPDRDYLRFADNPWVSYGEVNARANRVANSLIDRGVEPGESVSVMLPNCEEFLPVWYGILKAGAVMSSINPAYKGDFLSWPINLVEAKKLVIADTHLDRLDLIKADLPMLEHAVVLETGQREGPDPATLTHEPLSALLEGPDAEPDGIDYSWTDDARIMFTSGTTGRSKGVIKQNAADYFSARGCIEVVSRLRGHRPSSLARRDLLLLPAALPLQRPGALRATPRWWRAAGSPTSSASPAAGSGSRRSTPGRRPSTASAPCSTSSGTSRPRRSTGPTRSTPSLPRPAPRTSTTSSRSASGSTSPRATASPRPAWRPTWTRPGRPCPARWGWPTRATRSRSSSRAPTGPCRPRPRARSWST